ASRASCQEPSSVSGTQTTCVTPQSRRAAATEGPSSMAGVLVDGPCWRCGLPARRASNGGPASSSVALVHGVTALAIGGGAQLLGRAVLIVGDLLGGAGQGGGLLLPAVGGALGRLVLAQLGVQFEQLLLFVAAGLVLHHLAEDAALLIVRFLH